MKDRPVEVVAVVRDNPKPINIYDLNNLSRPLIAKVARYFEDPAVQADFERWKQDRASRAGVKSA